MEPLRVEFKLAGLVSVSDQPLHLDGLLAWAAVEQARRRGEVDLGVAAERLPLARRGDPKVWCASTLDFSFLTPPSFRTITRTTDVQDYAEAISAGRIVLTKPRDQLPTQSGPLRNFLLGYAVRQSDRAVAWCLGDPDGVRALVREIRHVGRHGRLGHGLVVAASVEVDPEAKKKWKLRHLPWPEPGYLPVIGNHRAPYWDRTTMGEVYAPPSAPIFAGERA